jgi:4-aminobutyrate aminotransferase
VAESARGLWINDPDGNTFLDFTSGIAVCGTGHCHPKVVAAIKKQADTLLHMSGTDFYYTPQIMLSQKLASLAPGPGAYKVYFGNSGAEAVEAAFKLARWHTRRELNLAFFGAFHGRTMGALSLTASKTIQKKHYNPLVPGITHIPYGYVPVSPLLSRLRNSLRSLAGRDLVSYHGTTRGSGSHIRRTHPG